MHRRRYRGSIPIVFAALLLPLACDSITDTRVAPQFHEEEDPVPCELDGVDCVGELDHPATYVSSANMHLLGFSSRVVPFGTSNLNTDLAFWGRTAYQGTYEGFRIIDISQPDNPTVITDYTDCVNGGSGSGQADMVIWNNILVRTWDANVTVSGKVCGGQAVPLSFEGLHIFDVSNPASPQLLGSVDLPCGSHTAMGVPDLENDRLLIYSSPSSGTAACLGLDIVAVPLNNPAAASYVRFEPTGNPNGGTNLRRCHDGSVIRGAVNLLACAGSDGVSVWSLSAADGGSLVDPAFLYGRSITGVTIGHSAAFTWDGEVLVFGHEPGGGVEARCQATGAVVDRSVFFLNARTGAQLGSFVLPRAQTASENCTWHNYNVVPTDSRYILVSGNYQSGISVVDFSDPANAGEIAFADPGPLVNPANPAAIVIGGDWSAYWYNGLIYESDLRRGLLVWRLNDAAVAGAVKLEHLNPQTQVSSSPLRGHR